MNRTRVRAREQKCSSGSIGLFAAGDASVGRAGRTHDRVWHAKGEWNQFAKRLSSPSSSRLLIRSAPPSGRILQAIHTFCEYGSHVDPGNELTGRLRRLRCTRTRAAA